MSPEPQVSIALGTDAWTAEGIPLQNELVDILRRYGVDTLDTARVYGNGASETAIGLMGVTKDFGITTKLPGGFGCDGSTREGIPKYAKESLEALGVDKVTTYLIHAPNPMVPITETLDALQGLYEEGRFEKLGLSNFTAAQVQEAYAYAKSKGYVLPTVFQGMYSLVARNHESTLFPTLRELGISIQAYSPVAAGFLVKTEDDIIQGKGRWDPSTPFGKVLNRNYNRPSLLEFLRDFTHLSKSTGIGQVELAYRWVRYNSALRADLEDMVIVGASKPEQLEQTLRGLEQGPLEDSIVEKLEAMWKKIEQDAPEDNYVTVMGLLSEGAISF
ncbi:hypothetical protein H2200_011904 [Cladophialophora chaetospira]|uniref:NADP-dependent oxidoreductase domain-containing protein n=1 Tax=Cladophialophora chaetospira TaxID=386627 RepID=A0AA38WZ20_9EURO|nr:hypothetical protein H2200_011904 [Cladophialophora chaetospira]